MELVNLNDLMLQVKQDFNPNLFDNERTIPQAFKQLVPDFEGTTLVYHDYTCVLNERTPGLNIVFPNQWFYIAAYMTDYYHMLQAYKQKVYQVLKITNNEQAKTVIRSVIDNHDEAEKLFDNVNYQSADREWLIHFVSDYSWWGGGKEINRGDFFVSPVLSLAHLVNASQSFVADLCRYLATNKPALNILKNEISNFGNGISTVSLQGSLDEPLQQIFFGAPGTGKSFKINEMCAEYENYRTTFHPDTDYASFVGSYKPITKRVPQYDIYHNVIIDKETNEPVMEDRIVYRYVFQAFLKAYIAAWREQQNENPKPVFLVVEEINRGNCAQIFGDIFQLLDRNEAGYSDYPIVADDDLAQELKREFADLNIANADGINALYKGGKDVVGSVKSGARLLLPNNLYIWATMNTSDQSLFPIDSAFKRRWDWKYIKIKDNAKDYKIVFTNGNEYDWWQFVTAINEKIEGGEIQQEDKKLGYFFAKSKNGIITADRFLSKVIFFLYNDVFKDFGFDEDYFKGADGQPMTFASYFDESGEANEDQIERFLTNLGLKPTAVEQASDDMEEAIERSDNVDKGSAAYRNWKIKHESYWQKCNDVLTSNPILKTGHRTDTPNAFEVPFEKVQDITLRVWHLTHKGDKRMGLGIWIPTGVAEDVIDIIRDAMPKWEEQLGLKFKETPLNNGIQVRTFSPQYDFDTELGVEASMKWVTNLLPRMYNIVEDTLS